MPLVLAPLSPVEPDAAADQRQPSNVRRAQAVTTAVPVTHPPAPASDASRPRRRLFKILREGHSHVR